MRVLWAWGCCTGETFLVQRPRAHKPFDACMLLVCQRGHWMVGAGRCERAGVLAASLHAVLNLVLASRGERPFWRSRLRWGVVGAGPLVETRESRIT